MRSRSSSDFGKSIPALRDVVTPVPTSTMVTFRIVRSGGRPFHFRKNTLRLSMYATTGVTKREGCRFDFHKDRIRTL